MLKKKYIHRFTAVPFMMSVWWGKVHLGPCASGDVVVKEFGSSVKFASKPGAHPGGLVGL